MNTRRSRELLIWQDSMSLAREVYAVTNEFPKSEVWAAKPTAVQPFLYAAISRKGTEGFQTRALRFFSGKRAARFSKSKPNWSLRAALDICQPSKLSALLDQCEKITRMLNSLLRSLRSGTKSPQPK